MIPVIIEEDRRDFNLNNKEKKLRDASNSYSWNSFQKNIGQSFPVANPLDCNRERVRKRETWLVLPVAWECVVDRKWIGCRRLVNIVAEDWENPSTASRKGNYYHLLCNSRSSAALYKSEQNRFSDCTAASVDASWIGNNKKINYIPNFQALRYNVGTLKAGLYKRWSSLITVIWSVGSFTVVVQQPGSSSSSKS